MNKKEHVVDENFLKFYIDNLDFIFSLDGKELKILFYLLKYLGRYNAVQITAKTKKNMMNALGISHPTISRALDGLKTKGVISPIDTPELQKVYEKYVSDIYYTDMFYINPSLVVKNSLEDFNRKG